MRVVYYEDKKHSWRWRITAENNRIVAASSEGYFSKWNAKRNFNKFIRQNSEVR